MQTCGSSFTANGIPRVGRQDSERVFLALCQASVATTSCTQEYLHKPKGACTIGAGQGCHTHAPHKPSASQSLLDVDRVFAATKDLRLY